MKTNVLSRDSSELWMAAVSHRPKHGFQIRATLRHRTAGLPSDLPRASSPLVGYMLGAWGVHAAMGGAALVDARQYATLAPSWTAEVWIVMSLIVLPVAVHAFVAWMSGFVRPCHLVTPGCASLLRGALGGIAAGMLAVLWVVAALVFFRPHRLDLLLTCVSPVPASGLVLGLSRRVRPGRCRKCGYVITPTLDMGRCPECGTAVESASQKLRHPPV